MKNIVFAITEEYNSKGCEIAKKLAKELNIPYYENEIISIASKESNICENIFYSFEELNFDCFCFPFSLDFGMLFPIPKVIDDFVPLQDKVFNAKSKAVKKLAKESCVILCKCANYMLKENENCINVLIYSSEKERQKLEKEKNNLKNKKINKILFKKDKNLKKYYAYYTGNKWDNKKSYDIFLNSSKLGVLECVNILKNIKLPN